MGAIDTMLEVGFAAICSPLMGGVVAIYTDREAGSPVEINVIFDAPTKVIDPVSGVHVGTTEPLATGSTDDLAGAGPGDLLIINGVVYEVLRSGPDGQGGMTEAFLTKSLSLSFLRNEEGSFIQDGNGTLIEIIL